MRMIVIGGSEQPLGHTRNAQNVASSVMAANGDEKIASRPTQEAGDKASCVPEIPSALNDP